jgi:hypothetical protein
MGCGGGGSDSSTVVGTGAQAHTVTAPNFTDKFKRAGGSGSTATAPAAPGAGAQQVAQALAPFRDCLRQHGVEPMPFGSSARQSRHPDPAEARKQIQARIACIPELPPKLRQAAEQLKKRYEQRQQHG